MPFETTLWSKILKAANGDPEAAEETARRYHPAVRNFLRKRGFGESDSDDLAQEVFLRVFREQILRRADRSRGRFRTLLIAVTRQVMGDHRRKHASSGVSLDDLREEPTSRAAVDEDFDRAWVFNLMFLAMERIREDCKQTGRPYYEALRLHLQGASHEKIAQALGTTVNTSRSWIHRAKRYLRKSLEDQVRSYASSQEEYSDELHLLKKYLERSP